MPFKQFLRITRRSECSELIESRFSWNSASSLTRFAQFAVQTLTQSTWVFFIHCPMSFTK